MIIALIGIIVFLVLASPAIASVVGGGRAERRLREGGEREDG